MKKKFLFFVLFFALFSSLFMLSSCAKENKNFEGLGFEDKSVMYDGQAHSLEVTGLPDFAKVSYTANSFIQVGVYEVTATVTAEGYNDWSKTSKLYILSPEGGVSVDGFEFGWKEVGKEYRITGYNGNATELIIPSSYNGLPVTEIGERALNNNNTLQSLIISENITDIGMGAVSVCERLEKIYFPNSIKRIEDFAFLQDRSLKEVHVPSLSVWLSLIHI